MASASHKGHEIKSVGHLHHRGQASGENQYQLHKCDQETRAPIEPGQWTKLEGISFLSLSFGLWMNEVIMDFGVYLGEKKKHLCGAV